MREVNVSELTGIELEWAFGEATGHAQCVHELDESLLYLVYLDESRKTQALPCEPTKDHGMAAILIERGRLNVSYKDSNFHVTGTADFRSHGDNPRNLSGTGENLCEAVARAVCSYCGDKFEIPKDVSRLHKRRIKADKEMLREFMA